MKILGSLGELVSKRPLAVVIGSIVFTVLLMAGAGIAFVTGHTELRTNINDLFPEYDEVLILNAIVEDFGDSDPLLVVVSADDVLTPEVFERILELDQDLKSDEQVLDGLVGGSDEDKRDSVVSLPAILGAYAVFKSTGEFNPTAGQIAEEIAGLETDQDVRQLLTFFLNDSVVPDIQKTFVRSLLPKAYTPGDEEPSAFMQVPPAMAGKLFGASAESMLMFMSMKASVSDEELEKVELYLRDEVIEPYRGDGVEFATFAFGILSASYAEAETAIEPLFELALIFMFAISFLNYRRISDTLLASAALFMVLIWSASGIGIMGFNYSLMNIMVPLMIMGLAIDFSFHALIGYRERLAGEDDPPARVRSAATVMIKFVGIAFVLATVTTGFGFLANVSSDLPAINEFGIVAAVSVLFILIINVTFLPAARVLLDLRRHRKGKPVTGVIPPERISAAPGKLLGPLSWTVRHPWVLIVPLLALAVPGYMAVGGMKASYDPTGELIESQEFTQAFRTLNDDYSFGTESIVIRVDGDFEDPNSWASIQESIDNAVGDEFVVSVDDVPTIEWIGAIMPSIAAGDPGYLAIDRDLDGIPDQGVDSAQMREALDRLADNSASVGQLLHKGPDGYDGILVRVATQTNIGEHGLEARDELEVDFQPATAQGMDVAFTGTPIIWNKGLNEFSNSLLNSTFLVMMFALILLGLVFGIIHRSVLLGVLTAIPAFVAVGWTLGFMNLADIPLNMMTALVGSLAIGLGIDYPIHLANRWVAERKDGNGVIKSYTVAMRSTGRELLFSAATTMAVFISLSLMPMPVMQMFGVVMSAAIVFAFLGAVLLLPMLLGIWHRDKNEAAEQ